MPNVAKELGEEHAKDKFMEACDASRKEKFGELSVLNLRGEAVEYLHCCSLIHTNNKFFAGEKFKITASKRRSCSISKTSFRQNSKQNNKISQPYFHHT
ncbi:unnamed protein product [Hermetia illucens]|uniref:Uncharacterized protein n=1 Tax=Hermetia illucens TaxID=343691 RepID=A0A7R8UBV9_HERIL|nr:unnamed protein product [Hermetia illucens]